MMRRAISFTMIIFGFQLANVDPAVAAADEPSGAIMEPSAGDLIAVCKANRDACELSLRLIVAWHDLRREFEESHPRFCVTESAIENGQARDAIIAVAPASGTHGMTSIDLILQTAFPC